MQFVVKRDDLLKSLNFVQGVVEKKNTLPILSNVLSNFKKIKTTPKIIAENACDIEINKCSDFVVQKYIENPLIIEKKKFDIAVFLTATDIPSIQQQQSHHQLNLMPTNNNYNSKVNHSSQLQNVTTISNNSINDHTFTSIENVEPSSFSTILFMAE